MKDNVIDMGQYSYRIKLLKMYRDPLYFAKEMFPATEFNISQKLYLRKILVIEEDEE